MFRPPSFFRLLILAALSLLAGTAGADDVVAALKIPTGTAPTVDGKIEAEEWAGAQQLPLVGGQGVYLKRSGDHLFLAIRGAKGGIGSVGLAVGDTIRVLHASTGLIEARYAFTDTAWTLVHDFRQLEISPGEVYPRGEVRQNPAYRKAGMVQFGWAANVVELGPATDMEYQISMAGLEDNDITLSVVFYQIAAEQRKAFFPATLADDTFDRALIAGTAKDGLEFTPDRWQKIEW